MDTDKNVLALRYINLADPYPSIPQFHLRYPTHTHKMVTYPASSRRIMNIIEPARLNPQAAGLVNSIHLDAPGIASVILGALDYWSVGRYAR